VVLRQTTHKPSTLVLRFNQETRTPRLHVHGADRTWHHPTSRSSSHRVPDLCNHPRSSTPGLLLLPRSSSLHAMPHLPPAQHETSKHDSPNEPKVKGKTTKPIPDSNSNLAKSMTHHTSNQGTDHLVSHRFPAPTHTQLFGNHSNGYGHLKIADVRSFMDCQKTTSSMDGNPEMVSKLDEDYDF
jgi:hypothetical protein